MKDDLCCFSDRVPLRDAVEHREAPFFGNVDHESIWIEPLAPPTLTRTEQIINPKVVCHLDSSAVHRVEPFSLFPQSIPHHRCSHLIYIAATLGNLVFRYYITNRFVRINKYTCKWRIKFS